MGQSWLNLSGKIFQVGKIFPVHFFGLDQIYATLSFWNFEPFEAREKNCGGETF